MRRVPCSSTKPTTMPTLFLATSIRSCRIFLISSSVVPACALVTWAGSKINESRSVRITVRLITCFIGFLRWPSGTGVPPIESLARCACHIQTASPLFHLRRGAIDRRGDLSKGCGDQIDLLFRLGPVALLDGFADRGQRLYPVAGVETGRVNLVLEPWAARQASLAQHRALGLHQ